MRQVTPVFLEVPPQRINWAGRWSNLRVDSGLDNNKQSCILILKIELRSVVSALLNLVSANKSYKLNSPEHHVEAVSDLMPLSTETFNCAVQKCYKSLLI